MSVVGLRLMDQGWRFEVEELGMKVPEPTDPNTVRVVRDLGLRLNAMGCFTNQVTQRL